MIFRVNEDHEIVPIYAALSEIRPVSSDLFIVLVRSGLRINEALGLCGTFIFQGDLDGKKSQLIHKRLTQYELGNYHGYICLESQPAISSMHISEKWIDRFEKTWIPGSVPRKPLKCRRRIDPKYFRYILIYDVTAWNILVDRALDAEARAAKALRSGLGPQDFLLFEGLTASMFASDLTSALKALKVRLRSAHKTRHTFLTWFCGMVGEDEFLADKIAGHRGRRDIERYSHLAELLGRERLAKRHGKQRLSRVLAR